MNYNRIKKLMEDNKVTAQMLCANTKISISGFWKMLEKETMKVKTLEQIADYFNVSISYFFDDDVSDNDKYQIVNKKPGKQVELKDYINQIVMLKKLQQEQLKQR
jgi:transcriptional regulator with XRE-family HTH domain